MLSKTAIDDYCWRVQRYLMERYGCDVASRDMQALNYFIGTGRASTVFLKALIAAKPYLVARRLHDGGSIDEAIARVRKLLRV